MDEKTVHPSLENKDFKPLQKKAPLFINTGKEEIFYEGEEGLYPFFINEAAYQENKVAMILAKKVN